MTFGFQLLSWRRHRGLTQSALAEKSGITRPYLSRLELDRVDPSLSLLRRLAVVLNLRVGELIDTLPAKKMLTNEELDRVARGALKPSLGKTVVGAPYIHPLSRLLKARRAALGLYKPRSNRDKISQSTGKHALRRMKVDLGQAQWDALLRRIDKHAAFLAPPDRESNENK